MNIPNTRRLSIVTFVLESVTFKLGADDQFPLSELTVLDRPPLQKKARQTDALMFSYQIQPLNNNFSTSPTLYVLFWDWLLVEKTFKECTSAKSEWHNREKRGCERKSQLWYGCLMAHLCSSPWHVAWCVASEWGARARVWEGNNVCQTSNQTEPKGPTQGAGFGTKSVRKSAYHVTKYQSEAVIHVLFVSASLLKLWHWASEYM